MATEVSKESKFTFSLETLATIGTCIVMIGTRWVTVQADIKEAKELPKPEVGRMEFQMKDQNIRNSIMQTRDDVGELKDRMIRMEDKIDQLK